MTPVPWRDGAQELRRLIMAEGGAPDRIADVRLAWRAFRAFLAVPLGGLFDRWSGTHAEADMLIVDFGVSGGTNGLLLLRRFTVPAVEWQDGVPGEQPEDDDDYADTVQIQLELTFPGDVTAEVDDFWTAARSGGFAPEDLAEAESLVMTLSGARALRSRVELVNPN
ncbi:hypothetical protein [Actinoplanes couchii]|uniref:Uncharacterized protein n=1 Tax=Actinoplanes couchii TaxID=403638 RepID=A0ABQ3XLL7_9ACTN|nr:hypothetical protein [Actinoplanes couchii]MDR6319396.1 hypothetical protein [Actinoplanes couchii]GID59393.1 hypothetical protein Aco03nite_077970 [Actinoplanes couchii]